MNWFINYWKNSGLKKCWSIFKLLVGNYVLELEVIRIFKEEQVRALRAGRSYGVTSETIFNTCTIEGVRKSDSTSHTDSTKEVLAKIVEDFQQENTEAIKEQLKQLAKRLYNGIPTTNLPVLSDKAIDLMIVLFFGLLEEGKQTSDYGDLTLSRVLGLLENRKLTAFFKQLPSESKAKNQYQVLFKSESKNIQNSVIGLARDCLEKGIQVEKGTDLYYLFFKEDKFRKLEEHERDVFLTEIKEKCTFSEEGSELITLGRNKTEFIFWTTNKNKKSQLISDITHQFKDLSESGGNNTEWSNYFYDSYEFFNKIVGVKAEKTTFN